MGEGRAVRSSVRLKSFKGRRRSGTGSRLVNFLARRENAAALDGTSFHPQSSLRLSVGVILFLPFLPPPRPSPELEEQERKWNGDCRAVLSTSRTRSRVPNEREIAEKFSKRCRNAVDLTRLCRRSNSRARRARRAATIGRMESSIRWKKDNGIRRAVSIDRIDVRDVRGRGPVSRPKGLFLPEGEGDAPPTRSNSNEYR